MNIAYFIVPCVIMFRTAQRCEWILPAALQMAELLIAQLASRDGRASTASAAVPHPAPSLLQQTLASQ